MKSIINFNISHDIKIKLFNYTFPNSDINNSYISLTVFHGLTKVTFYNKVTLQAILL